MAGERAPAEAPAPPTVNLSLQGRVALVTGAGRGIGRTTALALAASGADLVLTARSTDEIEGVAREVRELGSQALALPCDITDWEQVEETVATVEREHGGLQIVVNNAGGAPWLRELQDVNPEQFEYAMSLNLSAAHNVMRACAPQLFASPGRAAVVNITSIAAARGLERLSFYSAAKAGLVGLSRAAAREWGPRGVRVNCLGPGWIETTLSSGLRDDETFYHSTIARIPMRRWGRPEEIAAAVTFLASDAAAYINGATLIAGGGLLA